MLSSKAHTFERTASEAGPTRAILPRGKSCLRDKKTMWKKLICLSGFLLFALGTQAKADTIGPGASCASCFGSSYTLTYTTTANPNAFNVNLLIDASGYNQSNTDVLNAVSLKLVSNGSDISSVSLLSSPATFNTPILGGISAGGCHANSNNGFFCSQSSSGLQVGHSGDIYDFQFLVTVTAPSDLLTGIDAASVKASYLTANGHNAGITSEDITLSPGIPSVPEPATFVLLGTGSLGAAGAIRRKLSA